MATGLFESFLNSCLDGSTGINVLTDTIEVALVPNTSPPDLDDNLLVNVDDLAVAVQSATHRVALSSKTISSVARGVFDAANAVMTAAASSASAMDAILYKKVTNDTDSILIAYFDLASPVTPDGTDINVNIDPSGLFRLG